jgi:LacI family transcriptional regulator
MQLAQPPDAVFSASDFSALGFINYCREHDISVPGDVTVVGFANEPFTKIMHPELSSVEQFSGRMGTAAAELLFEQIDSEETEPSPRHIVIEGELRIRTSSSPKSGVTVPQRLIV